MGGRNPGEKLGSGRRVLLGCLPTVYKLLGMVRRANIYEWASPAKDGFEVLVCTVHSEDVECALWSRKDPGRDVSGDLLLMNRRTGMSVPGSVNALDEKQAQLLEEPHTGQST